MKDEDLVLELPGMRVPPTHAGVEYAAGRTLDVHGRGPAVVIATGYPDPGFAARIGCAVQDMRCYIAWAELIAASGMAAVRYRNQQPADLAEVLAYLRAHGADLGIDADRLAILGFSGNGPTAMSALVREPVRCGALVYAMLFGGGEAAKQFGFADPIADASVDDLRADLPLLVVRAGQDNIPGLNASIDRFAAAALARNLPVTIANLPKAPHAFDLVDDSETSREMMRGILQFLRFHLVA